MELEVLREEMERIGVEPARFVEGDMFGQGVVSVPELREYLRALREGSRPEAAVEMFVEYVLRKIRSKIASERGKRLWHGGLLLQR